MNAWSHLPNAHHIDRVIKSAKSHPEIWSAAYDAAWNTDRNEDRNAIVSAALHAARDVARYALLDAAQDEAWDAILDSALDASLNAAAALIAFDDASKYLDMPSDHLRILAILSETPSAVLLLPAVIAFERIRELECV
jgi:hypothetical protein